MTVTYRRIRPGCYDVHLLDGLEHHVGELAEGQRHAGQGAVGVLHRSSAGVVMQLTGGERRLLRAGEEYAQHLARKCCANEYVGIDAIRAAAMERDRLLHISHTRGYSCDLRLRAGDVAACLWAEIERAYNNDMFLVRLHSASTSGVAAPNDRRVDDIHELAGVVAPDDGPARS